MPSGMLCRVTAVNKSVVRFQGADRPSGCFAPMCRCAQKPGGLGLVDGGDQKRPNGRGDHDAGGKAQKHPLQAGGKLLAEKEYQAGAQRGHQKGKPCAGRGP